MTRSQNAGIIIYFGVLCIFLIILHFAGTSDLSQNSVSGLITGTPESGSSHASLALGAFIFLGILGATLCFIRQPKHSNKL